MPLPRLREARLDERDLSAPLDVSQLRIELTEPGLECLELRCVRSLGADELESLERLAYEHGETAESYLAIEPDRHCILSPDGLAAVSVVPAGLCLHISGGILAATEHRPQMIAQLTSFARRTGRIVACYAVGEQDRAHFEAAGWEVSKFGEETDLDLETLRWSGKPYEWVRRQFNFCKRAGLVCREIERQELCDASWNRLKEVLFEILHDDLKDRVYSREMGLLVGKLQPDNLGRRRLFVAENQKTHEIEGFLIANPMRGGSSWAIESYRKRSTATRGAIPFLIKASIDQLQLEGAEHVSLCMLLWKDTDSFEGNKTGGFLAWWLAFGRRIANRVYSADGMTHFKTRFRPELSNIYLCVTPKTTLFLSLSFLHAVGAFSFSIRNIVRSLLRSATSRWRRKET